MKNQDRVEIIESGEIGEIQIAVVPEQDEEGNFEDASLWVALDGGGIWVKESEIRRIE